MSIPPQPEGSTFSFQITTSLAREEDIVIGVTINFSCGFELSEVMYPVKFPETVDSGVFTFSPD